VRGVTVERSASSVRDLERAAPRQLNLGRGSAAGSVELRGHVRSATNLEILAWLAWPRSREVSKKNSRKRKKRKRKIGRLDEQAMHPENKKEKGRTIGPALPLCYRTRNGAPNEAGRITA
jgi:hypothetical protein